MISVIIPILNEAKTIASVVEFVRRDPQVSEVIVVDDGSIDGSPELAQEAGATVVTSTFLGKGASMEDGVRLAANEVLLFLDGDLSVMQEDLVRRMTAPITSEQADFVKSRFDRAAGRVTALTARPLLSLFFPELAHLQQPLAGLIAARRSLLQRLRFESDYGVDVGLLLDVVAAGARLVEVDVGRIEHDSQPLDRLTDMATQVARTILRRAARAGRLNISQLREVEEAERIARADLEVIIDKAQETERLALFDMDGVLLDGRFVVSLARAVGREAELSRLLDNEVMPAETRTLAIASLFTGVPRAIFEDVARHIPLMPEAAEVVVALRKVGYRVGIVTDSYYVASEVVRRRVFADFSVAHLLRFRRGQATGEITLCPAMTHPRGCSRHHSCKVNVLRNLLDRLDVAADNVVAVGDGDNDICLLRAAGRSIAYQPKTPAVQAAAQHVMYGSLTDLLPIVYHERRYKTA